jgi:hypothetical protein
MDKKERKKTVMTLLEKMDKAAREDRERFFAVADTIHLQPKYSEHLEELEAVKQEWRDMTKLEDYPQMPFPLPLPEWFPKVSFMSRWDSEYYEKEMNKDDRRIKTKNA